MMKIKEILAEARAALPAARHEADWLVSHYSGLTGVELALNGDAVLAAATAEMIREALRRRQSGEPLQYILGEQPFMDLVLKVTPAVLIPRWDSEAVVREALRLLPTGGCPQVADICTGSGAYALAVKYYRPQAEVVAVDISEDALAVARQNAAELGLAVDLRQGDLTAPLDRQCDLIVSNPPYIPAAQIAELSPEVRLEPRLALDGGADGLDFYRRLARLAPDCLLPGGRLLLEIGHDQCEAVSELLAAAGFDEIDCGRDLGGNLRWVSGRHLRD